MSRRYPCGGAALATGLLLLASLLLPAPTARAQTTFYSVARDDAVLRTVDPGTGRTRTGVQLVLQNKPPTVEILGSRGLAQDPTTGVLWAVLEILFQSGYELVRVDDPATGAAVAVGNTGRKIADLAFGPDGTLYGVTEDLSGSLQSLDAQLVALNLIDGRATTLASLGSAASYGEDDTLAFGGGFLYRTSGPGYYFPGRRFERIDPATLVRTAIALSGDIGLVDEFTALEYSVEQQVLIAADIQGYVYRLTPAGVVTRLYRASPGYVPTDLVLTRVFSTCQNGLDDDGDGLVDYPADPGCTSLLDGAETEPSLPCDDGLDDDGDGLADYPADPGCRDLSWVREDPACQDGLDNDGDGSIDFDGGVSAGVPPALATAPDPDCNAPWRDRAEVGSCGLGAELVVVLGALAGLRRRGQPAAPRRAGQPVS